MNPDHPNLLLLKNFDPNNIEALPNIFSAEMIWHYFNPRLPEMHGDYEGLKGFQDFFQRMGQLTRGTFKANPLAAFALGDELVVTHSRNTMALKDEQIETDAVVVWRIADGKITEAWDVPFVHTAKASPLS